MIVLGIEVDVAASPEVQCQAAHLVRDVQPERLAVELLGAWDVVDGEAGECVRVL